MRWANLCLALAGAASVIAGVVLLAAGKPGALRDWLLNHKLREVFARPWRVERFVYRHHRLFGGTISAGAMLLLARLYAGHNRLLGMHLEPPGTGVRIAELLVWALAVAALVIGMAVLIRPSLLKGIETLSNRWIQLPLFSGRMSWYIGILLVLVGLACLAAAKMLGA